MGFAAEMYFDSELEKAVRALRSSLTKSGVRPLLDELGDRPHISLALFTELDAQAFELHLKPFVMQRARFSVQFESVASFASVVFLKPTAAEQLADIHSGVHNLLRELNIQSIEYYRPENWVPHCTIAQDLDPAEMENALYTARRDFSPIAGTIGEIGLVQFRPVISLYCHPLRA